MLVTAWIEVIPRWKEKRHRGHGFFPFLLSLSWQFKVRGPLDTTSVALHLTPTRITWTALKSAGRPPQRYLCSWCELQSGHGVVPGWLE